MREEPKCEKCGSDHVALWDELSERCESCGQYTKVQWVCKDCAHEFFDVALSLYAGGTDGS